jgi:hypothetical protein
MQRVGTALQITPEQELGHVSVVPLQFDVGLHHVDGALDLVGEEHVLLVGGGVVVPDQALAQLAIDLGRVSVEKLGKGFDHSRFVHLLRE